MCSIHTGGIVDSLFQLEQDVWACSSVGRASHSHCEGQEFESPQVHQPIMANQINSDFPRDIEIIVGAIIENKDGKILLTKSPKWSNKWVMPGGHVDFGETISEAIIREAEEETGLKVTLEAIVSFGELINCKDFHRPAHFIYLDGYCRCSSSDVALDNKELTEYRWESPQNALKMDLAESYDRTINDFLKYKKSLK